MTPDLAEHFFRHEFGRVVAALVRRLGAHQLEAIEDGVQAALMSAVETWPAAGRPDNPSAWLFAVSRNNVLRELTTGANRQRLLAESPVPAEPAVEPDSPVSGEVADDLLRMLFVCCDDAIPIESQLALALKTLCGFSVREIAERLFATEARVYKRIGRARATLRHASLSTDGVTHEQLRTRLPAVHRILYVLFTEGYLSSHAEAAIRRELCSEAIRLGLVLADHPVGQTPETWALLALMHLHSARITARQDGAGGLLLLEEQDRDQWDAAQIREGIRYLSLSAQGDTLSTYHAEAGIAAEHCLAASFDSTRWDRVADGYELLNRLAPSPLHQLNRAVAVAQWQGPQVALELVEHLDPPDWLLQSFMWAAVVADLQGRCDNPDAARQYGDLALRRAPSPAVRRLIERRLTASQR